MFEKMRRRLWHSHNPIVLFGYRLRWIAWGRPERCEQCFKYIRRGIGPCELSETGAHVPWFQ